MDAYLHSFLFGYIRDYRHFVGNVGVSVGHTGKSVPLQACSGPEGFLEVKVPRFRDNGIEWW